MNDLSWAYCNKLWNLLETKIVAPIMGEEIHSRTESSTGYGDWVASKSAPGSGFWMKRFQHGTVKTLPNNLDNNKILPTPEPTRYKLWRQTYEATNGDVMLNIIRYHTFPDILVYMRQKLKDILVLELASNRWVAFYVEEPSPLTAHFATELTDLYLEFPKHMERLRARDKMAVKVGV